MYLELEVPVVRGPKANPLFSVVLDWYVTNTVTIDGFKLPYYFISRSDVYSSLAKTFDG
jgi:hypothetical protein